MHLIKYVCLEIFGIDEVSLNLFNNGSKSAGHSLQKLQEISTSHLMFQSMLSQFAKAHLLPFHLNRKKNFTAPCYGWGSTVSWLEPLWGGSLLFNTKFPEIFGTHFYRLRNDERLSRPRSYLVVLSMGPMNWESSALTSRPTSFTVNIVFLVFYEGFSHYYWFFLWSFNFSGFSWWLCVTFVLLVVEINIRISCFKLYFQDT